LVIEAGLGVGLQSRKGIEICQPRDRERHSGWVIAVIAKRQPWRSFLNRAPAQIDIVDAAARGKDTWQIAG
jgi:hypothetical protein